MGEIKLRPCPFCGGKAKINTYLETARAGYEVSCRNEDCEMIVATELYPTEEEAAAAWNRRYPIELTAKWVVDDRAYNHCSVCGYEWDKPEVKSPFCPKCGAYMDVEVTSDE